MKKVTVRCKLQKLLCMLLICSIVFTSTACASSPPALTLSDPNEQIITENIEVETIYSKTTTGATIIVGGSFNTSRNIDWIAIGT